MATTQDDTTAAAVDQVAPELDRVRAAEVLAAVQPRLPTPEWVLRHLLGPLPWPTKKAATPANEEPRTAEPKPKTQSKRQRRELRRKSNEP